MNTLEQLLSETAGTFRRRFRLRWYGTKIPHGARIGRVEIGWTQHGIVRGVNGEELGVYNRTVAWGGVSGDEHEMIIATDHPVIAPDGRLCEAA